MKKALLVVSLLVVFLGWSNVSHAQTFQDIFQSLFSYSSAEASDVIDLLESIGGFLMIVGGTLAGIVIIWSGIMYMGSGSNQTRVGAAKSILKNGLIGAIILFAAGVIMATVSAFALDPTGFFS